MRSLEGVEALPTALPSSVTSRLRAGGELKLTREESELRAGLLVGGERGWWIYDLPAQSVSGRLGTLQFEYRGSVDGELRLGVLTEKSPQPQRLALARRVAAGRWQRLEFFLDDAAVPGAVRSFTLHPPAAEVGECALRNVRLLPADELHSGSVAVGGVRRRVFSIGPERSVEWEFDLQGEETLEIGFALHPDRGSPDGMGLRLLFRQAGQDSLLLERLLLPSAHRFADFALRLPTQRRGSGSLRLETYRQAPRGEPFLPTESDRQSEFLLVSAPRLRRPVSPRPNVLLLVIDTLRADGMSSFGNARDTTPKLDRFIAEQCVRFDQAYATATWTHPSLGSILSGVLPPEHGLGMAFSGLSHFRAETKLLAEWLQPAGYATAAVSNNLIVSAAEGFAAGYDSFDERPLEAADFHGAARVSQAADEWLATHGAPFHLYLHYFDPHDRYQAPPPWTERFVPQTNVEVADGIQAGQVTALQARMFRQGQASGFRPSPLETEHLRALYDGEIAYTDQWISWLLERMSARGQLDNTLVILASDHGEEFLEHERLKHGHSLYEELLHVPLAIRFPNAAGAGSAVTTPVSLLDLVPTVLSACGLSNASLPGRDLSAATEGALAPEPIFALAPAGAGVGELPAHAMLQSVRDAQFKLIRCLAPPSIALFDLHQDGGELHDLSASNPAESRRLQKLLDEVFASVGDAPQLENPDPAALEKLRALGYAH